MFRFIVGLVDRRRKRYRNACIEALFVIAQGGGFASGMEVYDAVQLVWSGVCIGEVYCLLDVLVERGFVDVAYERDGQQRVWASNGRPRPLYAITDEGRRALRKDEAIEFGWDLWPVMRESKQSVTARAAAPGGHEK